MGFYFSNRRLDELTEKEEQWLSSLEAQHAEGKDLAPEDGDALAEYWQLQIDSQKPDLDRLRMDWEATYFRPWGDGIELERTVAFNYPAKVECYKQKRQHRTTARSVRQLIEDERKEQPGLKEQAKHIANLQGDPAEIQIKYDLIEHVYEEYEQFLTRESEGLEQVPIASSIIEEDAARPSLRQIALMHIYQRKPPIKKDQRADELAQQHGYKSGRKLYDHYRKLSKSTGITGLESNELPRIISDIQSILPLLSGAPEQAARAHLQTLKAKQDKI